MTTFTSRTGDALLVVDVQVDVMARCWQPHRVVETIADLVARARIAGTPVVWVRHQESGLDAASPGWQVVPELVPAPATCGSPAPRATPACTAQRWAPCTVATTSR
ncbi:hypothetical protein GCM10027030_24850 [Luteococcus sediminum]